MVVGRCRGGLKIVEKFLWDLAGVILFVLNVIAFIFAFFSEEIIWFIVCALVIVADVVYIKKAPTWLEV
jgi:hypothetical protein